MKRYILITGGLGFIGSHCVVELLNENHDIIVIDDNSNSRSDIVDKIGTITNKEFLYYNINLLHKNDLKTIFNVYEIWCVIHFAAFKSVDESIAKPLLYYENNIISTINLLNIMDKYKCKKIIFSSSASVYGDQKCPVNEERQTGIGITNPYGQTKYFSEQILKDLYKSDNSWSIVILRYFNPVGAHPSGLIGENPVGVPNNLFPHILRSLNNDKLYVYGNNYPTPDGSCIRDFIHVVDLAKGHLASLKLLDTNGCHIYNLGTGKGISVLELIDAFQKINGVKINYEFADRRNGDIEMIYADTSKANDELNWKTHKSLEDICKDGFNFYKKSNNF